MAEGGLVSKSADNLGFKSRNFYENALFKVFLSIVYAAFALFCLGFSSQGNTIKFASCKFVFYLYESYQLLENQGLPIT